MLWNIYIWACFEKEKMTSNISKIDELLDRHFFFSLLYSVVKTADLYDSRRVEHFFKSTVD